LIAVLASTARASDEFNRPGPYIGLGAAGGLTNFSGALHGFGNSPGFNFRGGYRFNDYMAIEGLYEYMDDFGKSATSPDRFVKASANIQTSNFLYQAHCPTLGLKPWRGGIGPLNASAGQTRLIRQETTHQDDDGGVAALTGSVHFLRCGASYRRMHCPTGLSSLSAGVKYNF
jgi:hypothetical protein